MSTYNSKRGRYAADSEWGELYGLKPTELSDEQLEKINFNKLLEFVETDTRAEKLVGNKLLTDPMDKIEQMKSLTDEEIQARPYLLSRYNEFVATRDDDIDAKASAYYSDGRSKWVRWGLLNQENRHKEIKRLITEKQSIVNLKEFDHQELYNSDPYLANDLIKLVIKTGHTEHIMTLLNTVDHAGMYRKYPEIGGLVINHAFKAGTKVLRRTIEKMPKEVYLAILPKMFEQVSGIYEYALCHTDTPRGYALQALRVIAKRRNIPPIKTPITTSMLKDLPPVLRLDVLESIMYNSSKESGLPFPDLDEDTLRHILFTTSIRHNRRVDYVVNKFKQLKGETNEQI
jgi:hypothetical protein